MQVKPLYLTPVLLVASCLISSACTTAPTATENQRSQNANTAQSNSSQTNSSAKPAQQSDQSTTGSIEVTSVPPGARVLLVSMDAGGAGEPQSKGVSPTPITGLQPGKYTVDLEKTGYKFFQKEVEVKPRKTMKVHASLNKQ